MIELLLGVAANTQTPMASFTVPVEIKCETIVYKPEKCILPLPQPHFYDIKWVKWNKKKAIGYARVNDVPVKIVFSEYVFDGKNNLFTSMSWEKR